jgi:hypothetical protein
VRKIHFGCPIAAIILVACFLSLNPGFRITGNAIQLPSLLSGDSSVSTPYVNRHMISEGEDLLYEVSWMVFKIGTVRLKTLQTKLEDGIPRYTAAAFIDSYDGLPFVNLHAIAYTEMDSSLTARRCRSVEQKSEKWWGMHYRFDLMHNQCYVEETWQKDLKSSPYKRTELDTLSFTGNHVQDGLSILYFARSRAHQPLRDTVPIVAYGKAGASYFRFANKRGEEELSAVPTPVRVMELDGRLDIEGLFGLTGYFKGWFSDDSAAVPIKAKMKVILGSVNVELIEWYRSGWNPPQQAPVGD